MQDTRSGGKRSLTMAKDQLRQHRPADGPPASAENLHAVSGPSHQTIIPKHASATASQSDTESKRPENPLTPQPISKRSTRAVEAAGPASALADPQLADETGATRGRVAQDATLRRLNGLGPQPHQSRDSRSTASTQPVLVRKYSKSPPTASSSNQLSGMRQKRRSRGNKESSEMPSLERFSFQDILASIDPEVSGSIDKIAEICGRSKMSLADEYSSHLPPQADFSMSTLQEHTEQVPIPRLEPVEEASSTHEDTTHNSQSMRSEVARLSIAGESTRTQKDLLSAPVTATSAVALQAHSTAVQETVRQSDIRSPYIPQLLVWLRSSQEDSRRSSQTLQRNSGAANALQRILGSHTEHNDP